MATSGEFKELNVRHVTTWWKKASLINTNRTLCSELRKKSRRWNNNGKDTGKNCWWTRLLRNLLLHYLPDWNQALTVSVADDTKEEGEKMVGKILIIGTLAYINRSSVRFLDQ
ncbi:hypothetical protein CEXT_484191 [Caerostris extrusa]|uniref:Uncharacterized protein n=1 Tax=Caerostris extrusa TaxID=172846 RepID=A0AAV4NU18_CAEEX|nr:hypothetical protein CEXT_484191 [Caerostris extrusa]